MAILSIDIKISTFAVMTGKEYTISSIVAYHTMLEQLFGSRTRIKLLKLFLAQPHEHFFVRELTRVIGERINSVRREIANLERLGVVAPGMSEASTAVPVRGKRGAGVDKRKFYHANSEFVLFHELKNLVFKSQLLVGRSLKEAIEKLGTVRMLALTGFFVSDDLADTDLLVVGGVKHKRLAVLIRQLEKSFGHPIRYTHMTVHEFKMRRAMTDKFLYKILEGEKMLLVDQIDA